MCGITGLIHVSQRVRKLNRKVFEEMDYALKIQAHRGPDDSGCVAFDFGQRHSYPAKKALDIEKSCVADGIVGFNRLSIKDLTAEGHQPMLAINGQVILTFNGEIYNDRELRENLQCQGWHFKSKTDTEVVLNCYLAYGFREMLNKLNGMFAISIVDLRSGEIWLARDRFGIKPMYYMIRNDILVFGSELKGILAFKEFDFRLDENAFMERMIFNRPGSAVLIEGVELLEPGCAISIKYGEERVNKARYYDIDCYERESRPHYSMQKAMEELEDILSRAIARQMVSDVKVGCQLSGGVDSTLVSYFAGKNRYGKIEDAISVVDAKGMSAEEPYIDYVGEKLGLQVHKTTLAESYFLEHYERMIWHNDAPVYQPYFICFLKLAEEARNHVTVLLSGEGADEVAGGYPRFAAGVYQPFIQKTGEGGILRRYSDYAEYAVMADQTIRNPCLQDVSSCEKVIQNQLSVFQRFHGSNLTKHLKYEIYERLPEGLLRQDKMTMACSIENRVPLLDNEVVDFLMRIPEEMLVRFMNASPIGLSENPLDWVTGKSILKEVVSKHLGWDFAYRKKEIMTLDKRAMLTSVGFQEYFYDYNLPSMKKRGLLNAECVEQLYSRLKEISNLEFTCLWRAISMETWCQIFLDRRGFADGGAC